MPHIDFTHRPGDPTGFPYVVTVNRRVVARTKAKSHAGLLCWAMAVEGLFTDRRTLAFVAAVVGMAGMHAPTLKTFLRPHLHRSERQRKS